MPSKMPATRPSTISGWSLAKSARTAQTSAISLLASAVVARMRVPLHLLGDVVDVRRPGDAGVDLRVGHEGGGGLEGGGGELVR